MNDESSGFQTGAESYMAELSAVAHAVGCSKDQAAIIMAKLAYAGYTLWTKDELEQLVEEVRDG